MQMPMAQNQNGWNQATHPSAGTLYDTNCINLCVIMI